MALPESNFITVKEYLALDFDSDIRYEYADGQIFAMAGASREHNIIALNTSTSLNTQLRDSSCEIYQSDMRVQTKANAAYRYPDIVVVCDEPVFADTNPVSLTNPTLIIEVLSQSTADTDHYKKAEEFRQIASVREYVLIAQDKPHIQRYLRQDDINWLFTELSGLERKITLESIACTLSLDEIYRRITFEDHE